MRLSLQRKRFGFTLIELLVVITLIGILATMLFFSFPSFSGQNTVSSAADRIVGALLNARQRAKRDGRITGVRISQDAFGNFNVLQYVQQPDDYSIPSGGTLVGTIAFMGQTPQVGIPKNGWPQLGWTKPGMPMADTIFINRIPSTTTFLSIFPDKGTDATVQPGDYIEINGGGPVHQIVSINSPKLGTIPFDSITVYDANLPQYSPVLPQPQPVPNPQTTPGILPVVTFNTTAPNYRIIRQPRLLSGEADIALQQNIGLDFSSFLLAGKPTPFSNLIQTQVPSPPQWIPQAEWPPQPPLYADILFTPSGAVTGQGASAGQLYLWVRDLSADNTTNILNGFPVLVAVQMTTGFISSQQPSDPNDPFAVTRDGRGSGS